MMRRRWRCGGLAAGWGVRESSESPPPADICWRRRGRGVRFDLPSGGDPSPVAASLELLSFFFFSILSHSFFHIFFCHGVAVAAVPLFLFSFLLRGVFLILLLLCGLLP